MQLLPKKVSAGHFSLKLVTIAGVCLMAGLTVRHFLSQAAHQPVDLAPLHRQGLNAPFITTPDLVVEKMVELAELKDSDLIYDLGCGDGRIVITAALNSGCNGIGFDIDPERVAEATENAELHDVDQRVQIIEQDVFTLDLSEADAVMMYLLPWMMNKLLPQFQQMRPGCPIVSHGFWIDGVEPEQVVEMAMGETGQTTGIYVYRTPLTLNPAMEKGKPPQPRDLP